MDWCYAIVNMDIWISKSQENSQCHKTFLLVPQIPDYICFPNMFPSHLNPNRYHPVSISPSLTFANVSFWWRHHVISQSEKNVLLILSDTIKSILLWRYREIGPEKPTSWYKTVAVLETFSLVFIKYACFHNKKLYILKTPNHYLSDSKA